MKIRPALFVLACSLCTLASAADGRFEKVLYAKGGATPTCLEWKAGGEQPVVALDYGPRTVGGYAVFKVKSFAAQGVDGDGRTVGHPVLRLSYATHPDGLSATGCFTRRGCAHYLGPYFDNPVLRANGLRYLLRSPARRVAAHLLLPQGKTARALRVNGEARPFTVSRIGDSAYVDAVVEDLSGVCDLEVLF